VNFTNGKALLIYLGDSPSFIDNDTQLDAYSGFNVIGNNDSGRYDTATGLLGGSPSTTYSAAGVGALALAGSLTVANIQYVEDPTYGQHETLFSIGGAAQLACPEDAFQLRYVSNLGVGDSVINISNDGASSSGTTFSPGGNLCVGVYSFDENEELLSCCSCFVTPNGLANLSAQAINATSISGGTTTSSVIKLLAFQGTTAASCTGATISSTASPLASGLHAWGTTVHALPVYWLHRH